MTCGGQVAGALGSHWPRDPSPTRHIASLGLDCLTCKQLIPGGPLLVNTETLWPVNTHRLSALPGGPSGSQVIRGSSVSHRGMCLVMMRLTYVLCLKNTKLGQGIL